ncbi:fungal-specific transcription factor domain-containing protein [Dactylonectria estremocensis]|uniref:Fungal-specific transcription factor domain-containing protein n=1 Tax=Dactylonectria estremocensis TaxID=1079267 RepID=A0A9P9ECC4_9HYPO|nr:fungal-specific transcription factor domain-containing protein [Dactylonectria estremocensis]
MTSRPSRQRAIRYTGCWTCKSRKVRCDERPSACGNCEKRGVPCGGYDIRLQWMSDPFGQPTPSTTSNIQGRRRIVLDRASGRRYRMQEINDFLATIERDAESMFSFRKGPFSIFPAIAESRDEKHTSVTPHLTCSIPLDNSEINQVRRRSNQHTTLTGLHHDDHDIQVPELSLISTASSASTNSHSSPDTTSHLFGYSSIRADLTADKARTCNQEDMMLDIETQNNKLVEFNPIALSTPTSRPSELIHLPIQHIRSSLLGDTEADLLMHHYMVHVADVLQAILHTRNPYRGLYVPTAIEGACIHVSDNRAAKTKLRSALYHALLASAAYHLWNCDKAQIRYKKLAVEHKYRAIHSLQDAVNSQLPGSDHHVLLMAMLSLVTIGVMSGDDDFMVHLNGITQLRNSRRRWKTISGQTRQLNEIGAFLALMARTTSFTISPSSPWIESYQDISFTEDSVIQSGGCFEFMYGVKSSTAAAIHETCRLAEFAARFGDASLPDDLLAACEALGDKLLSWTLESEKLVSIPSNDDGLMTIFNHQASAWHHAALIYYYRRIQRFEAQDLLGEVRRVAEHAHAAEDSKATLKYDTTNIMAPITWPIFIASMNTVKSERGPCRAWWERVQHYGIANINKQWETVQRAWEREDEMEEKGIGCARDWTDTLKDLGTHVFPV